MTFRGASERVCILLSCLRVRSRHSRGKQTLRVLRVSSGEFLNCHYYTSLYTLSTAIEWNVHTVLLPFLWNRDSPGYGPYIIALLNQRQARIWFVPVYLYSLIIMHDWSTRVTSPAIDSERDAQYILGLAPKLISRCVVIKNRVSHQIGFWMRQWDSKA